MKTLKTFAVLAALIPAAAMAETVEGVVEFSGKVPTAVKLHREADPFCAKKSMTDPSVEVKGGNLANVWVNITKGAPAAKSVPDKTVSMNQKDCMYSPRVTTAVVGEKIEAKNDDPVLHNVHVYSGAATLFNKGMPNSSAAPIETVAKEEGMMKWKCDVHPWMRGYIGISKSGLQDVTNGDGGFKIADVPPGRYTIEAWHEKYGIKKQEITVEAGKPVKIVFKYDGTEKA